MTLEPGYLEYPGRKRGQDHDLYGASFLPDRKPVEWPGGARVAVWLVPVLEFFPFDMNPRPEPFMPPGGLARLYPDYWNYTLAGVLESAPRGWYAPAGALSRNTTRLEIGRASCRERV